MKALVADLLLTNVQWTVSQEVWVDGGRGEGRPAASVFLCLGDKLQSCVLIPTTLTSLTVPALKHIAGNFALTFRPALEKVHSPSSIVLSVLLSSSFILSKSYHRTKDSWTRGLCFVESWNTLTPPNFYDIFTEYLLSHNTA
jgi:hypothetical protein